MGIWRLRSGGKTALLAFGKEDHHTPELLDKGLSLLIQGLSTQLV